MKRLIRIGLILGIAVSLIHFGVSANSVPVKDITKNDSNYRNQEVLIVGKIKSVLYRVSINTALEASSVEKAASTLSERDLYVVSDENEIIYVLSTKHFEKNQEVKFTTNILLNSKDEVAEKHYQLFDKYILERNTSKLKENLPPSDYSQKSLDNFLSMLPKNKFWVLLIDVGE